MAWGGILRRIGANQFRDLGSGIITFDNAQGQMKASLEYLGEIFFAGSRIEEPVRLKVTFAPGRISQVLIEARELNATYRLSMDKGNLMLRNNWNPPSKLVPLAQDEFESDLGTLARLSQ